MKKLNINKRLVLEFLVIAILGTFFHFIYDLSGNSKIIAAIAPVNESVWEHLKLAVFPTIFVLLIEKKFIDIENFWSVMLTRIAIPIIFIPLVFYSYTSIVGEPILAIDIASFYISIIIGALVEKRIFKDKKINDRTENVSKIFILFIISIFVIFTFLTPECEIFRDIEKNSYGIIS